MALAGYPARDLLLEPAFIARTRDIAGQLARNIRRIGAGPRRPADQKPSQAGRPLSNAAALLRDGVVDRVYVKSLLPTYDVFDEAR